MFFAVLNNNRMNKKFIFMFLLLLTFASCYFDAVFKEVKINNRYTILIPDYLQPCTDLHKDASLQYQNTEKDVYALVIDEKKKTMMNYDLNFDVDLYFNNIAKQGFIETIKNGKISIPGRETINGSKALIADITGTVDQTQVFYKMGILETPFTFYQVIIWCRAENKQKYEKDMIKMIESFKEMPLPKEELPELKQPTLADSVTIKLKY